MGREWLDKQERGSPWLIRLITWITLRLGRPVGRALLVPICLYFITFSGGTRRVSRDYLRRVLGRKPRFSDLFRHYFHFASALLDRVYLLAGREDYFDIEVHGMELLERVAGEGRGAFLLGSHLGSFEVLRVLGASRLTVPLRILMHKGGTRRLNAILSDLNPGLDKMIIPVGGAGALLAVRETLDEGGLVGILGDRVVFDEKTVTCDFLGAPAPFPGGPMLLAGLLGAPVVLFFGLYRGGRRYEIFFEEFSDRVSLSREDRLASVRPWVQRYAERLEHYCRMAPYDWFNFYEFWDRAGRAPRP